MRGNDLITDFKQDANLLAEYFANISSNQGVPQRSVLSCTLFSVTINNITSNLPRDIQSSLYADDLMIYSTSNYLPSVERRLQHAINCIYTWASNHGFTISENKTIDVHYNRKRGNALPKSQLENTH